MQLTKLDEYTTGSVFPPQFSNEIYLSENSAFYFAYRSVFSIKYMAKGREIYRLGSQEHQLPEGAYLLVNNAQDVATIPTHASEQAMSIFLEPELLADVSRSFRERPQSLADKPFDAGEEPAFFEYVYRRPDCPLQQYLGRLFHFLRQWHQPGAQLPRPGLDLFFEIAEQALLSQQEVSRSFRRVEAAKKPTREELFRRVLQGRDYLMDNCCRQVSLQEVARAACLSPYHFHRTFRQAFGQTPLHFSKELKMKKAWQLLRSGHFSVAEAAFELGYPDVFSFSKDFKKRTGQTPGSSRPLKA